MIVLSGTFDITASGQRKTLSAGDVILVEDTHGHGHSSTIRDGATAVMIALEPSTVAGGAGRPSAPIGG